jgi:hypothetical protein
VNSEYEGEEEGVVLLAQGGLEPAAQLQGGLVAGRACTWTVETKQRWTIVPDGGFSHSPLSKTLPPIR